MRYAIVSDLHANSAAWQTVLTDIADLKADKIICLGDVTGYGPHPVAVLESVYRVVNVTLLGNHDAAVCGKLSTDTFSSRAASAVARHREQLAPAALDWLGQLPLTHAESGFRCAHSDFSDPAAFRYIVDAGDALPSWKVTHEQLLFVGHSHLPGIYVVGESGIPHFVNPCDFELEPGKRYIINPGSVGYPRVGDCRSSYCLFDDAARSITFRQLPFDSAGYRAAMQGAGWDDDPWIKQKAQQQHRPTLRKSPGFAKVRPPAPDTQARPKAEAIIAPAPLPHAHTRRNRLALLAVVVGVTLAAGFAAFTVGRTTVHPMLAITVPEFDLPSLAAYPLTPSGKNLLPPLPPSLNPDGRLQGWRYAFEDRGRQTFRTGLRDGVTTLCIHNAGRHKAQLESPLINLAGTRLDGVRLRGQIRKPDPFNGTVFYQFVTYTTAQDGSPVQRKTDAFEMRTSKQKLSPPGADRNVRIPLGKQITHVRFRIEADFEGTLEIEQPKLTGEVKEVHP